MSKSSAEASLYRCGRNLAPPGSPYQSGLETEILLTAQRTMRRDPRTGAGCTGNLVTHASPHVSPATRELRFSIGCPLAGFMHGAVKHKMKVVFWLSMRMWQ